MNTLPKDIIHTILKFSDAIKWRNGKYMNQIPKNDARYKLLTTIPTKQFKKSIQYVRMNDGRMMEVIYHEVFVLTIQTKKFIHFGIFSPMKEIDQEYVSRTAINIIWKQKSFFCGICLRGYIYYTPQQFYKPQFYFLC